MNAQSPGPVAYFFGFAALVAAGLLAFQAPATAERSGIYHLVAHSNESSNVGIFRINETTGQVSFCYIDTAGTSVRCTAEVQ